MLLNAVLSRFLTATPLAVAARGALEYALATDAVDALFDQTVGPRAGRTLLFSTCVDLMSTVVCRIHPSIHAAARATPDLPVTVSDVYARRNRMPSAAGAALVRHTAARLEPVLRAMGGAAPDRLPGYRLKILDGNHVAKTPRRLQPLRDVAAGPLPGQTLVVLDPALGLALDIVCSDDGHAQERALLGPIVASVALGTCGSGIATSAPPGSCSGCPTGAGTSSSGGTRRPCRGTTNRTGRRPGGRPPGR
ncbi:hypothetical protein [Fimbriiglobus ruber]|uniref:Mobile element protein n=1 Tax=Fimbriiglobus ruber TaxID=1908690 RepID=A0A225D9T4_9BACT|nr:hypothetical protein [Fimbriiglobus ruber]OWK35298.1 Mobile element protein [Fimbriiglobus ruber]